MEASLWEPEKANRILSEFETSLTSTLGESRDRLFNPALELYRQAIRAYGTKALALASLGCRASIENAGFLALAHRGTGAGGWNVVPPRSRDDSPLFGPEGFEPLVNLSSILRQLGRRKLLLPFLGKAAWRIKKHGDAIAHYAEITYRARYRGILNPPAGSWQEKRIEADAGEVLADLQATGEILLRFVRAHLEAGRPAQTN